MLETDVFASLVTYPTDKSLSAFSTSCNAVLALWIGGIIHSVVHVAMRIGVNDVYKVFDTKIEVTHPVSG